MQQIIPPPHPWRSMRKSGSPLSELEQRSIQYPIPRRGEQKLLVLLVDFPDPDRSGLFTGQTWQNFFFGPGGFSDYYQEVSYGQLRYKGDVVGMSGDSYVVNDSRVAYLRLPHSISYYANNEAGQGYNFPHNTSGVVYQAVQALDDEGFDFAPYANSRTQFIENLIVVFAGLSAREEPSRADTLMPTAYSLQQPYVTQHGQSIRDFTFCPERHGSKMVTLGVSVHEHGHALGMCDLYDQSLRTIGVGRYDVMGYGIEPDGFNHPVHFGAFVKAFLGWVQFSTQLQQGVSTITLPPTEATQPAHGSQSGRFIKLYPNGDLNSPEYFLLENRQPLGFDSDWVRLGLSPGLIIWHVDERIAGDVDYQQCNVVNTPFSTVNDNCFTRRNKQVPLYYGVKVVEADGYNNMVSEQKKDYGTSADTWVVGKTWRGVLQNGQDSGLSVSVLRQHEEPDNRSIDLRIEGWFKIAT